MRQRNRRSVLSVLLPLAGAVFCGLVARGVAGDICITSGCDLYKDMALFGLSLWWWGMGVFVLMAGLALCGLRRVAFALALVALLVDCLLLVWMALVAPCLNCMIAGVFFAATAASMAQGARGGRRVLYVLLGIWALLYTPNLTSVFQESTGAWELAGSPSSTMRIFFSPTCPACRKVMMDVSSRTLGGVAYYPLAKNDVERVIVENMVHDLQSGMMLADSVARRMVRGELSDPGFVWSERLRIQLGLLRNRIAFRRAGGRMVPLILMSGYSLSPSKPAPGGSGHAEPAPPQASPAHQ